MIPSIVLILILLIMILMIVHISSVDPNKNNTLGINNKNLIQVKWNCCLPTRCMYLDKATD